MSLSSSQADALLAGDPAAVDGLAAGPLELAPDNLVERPWGGNTLIEFKGLKESGPFVSGPFGESFEIAADDQDGEARQFPSQVVLSDRSRVSLPRLLEVAGDALLGPEFLAAHGARFPLLPKLLNIRELLSVQGHPAGNTEAYIIVAAEPGATLRLGFKMDMDGSRMTERLGRGRADQERLLAALPDMEPAHLQQILAPALADRQLDVPGLAEQLLSYGEPRGNRDQVVELLSALADTFWWMLDAMNVLPVEPGQVIHNCTPARLVAPGEQPAAEVHALGNPEGREILALEIRKPGPTFRAWDNVRFPIREVDVAAAVAALNLRATAPEEFSAPVQPVVDRPGAFLSIASPDYRIEHLRPLTERDVLVSNSGVHCLHGLRGTASLALADGTKAGEIAAGESRLMPIRMGDYALSARDGVTEVVKVSVPS